MCSPILKVHEKISAYLEDDTPLRLARDVLAGLEHAQGHTVQKYNQHAHMLEPGDHESRKGNLTQCLITSYITSFAKRQFTLLRFRLQSN